MEPYFDVISYTLEIWMLTVIMQIETSTFINCNEGVQCNKSNWSSIISQSIDFLQTLQLILTSLFQRVVFLCLTINASYLFIDHQCLI